VNAIVIEEKALHPGAARGGTVIKQKAYPLIDLIGRNLEAREVGRTRIRSAGGFNSQDGVHPLGDHLSLLIRGADMTEQACFLLEWG
jgi:hypothetical protein